MKNISSVDKRVSYTAADTIPIKCMLDKELLASTSKGIILPIHIQFMPTNKCNLNCTYCSCSKRDKNLAIRFEDAVRIIDIYAELGTKAVTITGGGEPLCYPRFDELVSHFVSRNIQIGLITNGMLLHKYKTDTLQKLTWCRISTGDDRKFSKQYSDSLYATVSKASNVDWAFSHVVSNKPNIETISRIIHFANVHNFTHVRLVSDIFFPEEESSYAIKGKLDGIDDSLVVYQGGKKYTAGGDCYVGYLKPVIAPDLQVYPCCGVQYASVIPARDMSTEFALGHAFNLTEIISKSNIPFNGSKCVRCYYSRYNEILGSLLKDIKHKEFV